MKKFVEIFLGVLTAMGGFVEVGELVFSVNAGAKFGFRLLWVVALGTIGIIAFCEMAGRVAAVKGQPVFNLIRERAGLNAGLVTLVAANLVNLLTCTAEIGGIALLWQLLSGWPYRWLALLALLFLLAVVWVLSFQWIERVFGLLGLLMCTYLVAAYYLQPDWGQVAAGFVPSVPLPYETYFYASGAIEDGWNPGDVKINRVIVIVGFVLGSLLAVALIVCGAQVFQPRQVEPQLPGEAALAASMTLGRAGLLAAIGGMFFAFAGAAIETALSGAYNLAQFLGWPWGKYRPARTAARFSLTWIVTFVLAALIVMTGVDPVSVVEYSIVFSVVILPFTYFPVLVIAGDAREMGEEHVNGWFAEIVGWFYLVIVTLAA